jgi:hypothetical protein
VNSKFGSTEQDSSALINVVTDTVTTCGKKENGKGSFAEL